MGLCKNGSIMTHRSVTLSCALLLFILSVPQTTLAAADPVIIPEGTRIYLQLNNNVSTNSSREGDPFKAIVTEPVYVGDRMIIPKGSVVSGSISHILRPGRLLKGKAALTLLFQSINIPGHGELPIVASLAGVDGEGNKGISTEGTDKGGRFRRKGYWTSADPWYRGRRNRSSGRRRERRRNRSGSRRRHRTCHGFQFPRQRYRNEKGLHAGYQFG